ncbi:MAG: hypothetical protein MK102_13895 [Fuerstiella sp.]|nr:hypothetical protein [Fuerstiella sp.]
MIVIILLVILLTCWSLWGLCVGESTNIRWIRQWCGGIFVLMVALLSLGTGFLIARTMERSSARRDAFTALQLIADRIEAGNSQLVVRKIRALDHRGDPDADAYDLLTELPEFVTELRLTPQSARIANDKSASLRR